MYGPAFQHIGEIDQSKKSFTKHFPRTFRKGITCLIKNAISLRYTAKRWKSPLVDRIDAPPPRKLPYTVLQPSAFIPSNNNKQQATRTSRFRFAIPVQFSAQKVGGCRRTERRKYGTCFVRGSLQPNCADLGRHLPTWHPRRGSPMASWGAQTLDLARPCVYAKDDWSRVGPQVLGHRKPQTRTR